MMKKLSVLLVLILFTAICSTVLYSAEAVQDNAPGKLEDSLIRDLNGGATDSDVAEPVPFHFLPKTDMGYVDWSMALRKNKINPLSSINESADKRGDRKVVDLDIYFKVNSAMEDVLFSHKSHTLWLDCSSCHPSLFKMRKGSSPVSMKKIQQGDYCGRCHGIVAFPLYDCERCHSYSSDN